MIPIKARLHPKIALFVNNLFRMNRESKAVVTMFPPLDICQTELSTKFNAIFERSVDKRSKTVGQMATDMGASGLTSIF